MGVEQVSSALEFLTGYNVNLYVGEETVKGKLIRVEQDHVILENENNYVYYFSIDQIQAITKSTKQFQKEETTAEFLQTQSMKALLDSLENSWVTILCLNKQKFNGIISSVDNHFVTLISGEQRVLIKLSHISNILKGYIKEDNNNNQSENQDNNEIKNEAVEDVRSEAVEDIRSEGEHVSINEGKSQSRNYGKDEERNSDHYQEAVLSKSEEKPAAIQPKEILGESIPAEAPIISALVGKESKIWSQSIRTGKEKQNEILTKRNKSEGKKVIEDTITFNKKVSTSSITNESKSNRQKEKAQKSIKEETIVKEVKVEKEIKVTEKTEPVSREPLFDPFSLPKRPSGETLNPTHNKKNDSRQEPFMNPFRFAGEPVNLQEVDRPSIFAGWPNNRRKKS